MRWITAVVLTCLLVSTPAFAVVSSVVTHTFQSAAAATGNGTALDVSKYNSLAVQIMHTSGTFTVTFEGTIDNTNWVSLTGTSIASTSATLSTSATADGLYQFNTSGLSSVRMRISACSSCVGVTVSGVLTTAVASKKGGAGSSSPHALLDGSQNNDTLAGTPVRGDVICANSTPAWVKLARGSTGQVLYIDSNGDCQWGTVDAATRALDNLASVAINAALLPGTAGSLDFGSATKTWAAIYLAGTSGTPGTNNFKITGASTSGTRTITLPDASVTVAGYTGSPANNDCPKFAVSGGVTTLVTSGAACGGSGTNSFMLALSTGYGNSLAPFVWVDATTYNIGTSEIVDAGSGNEATVCVPIPVTSTLTKVYYHIRVNGTLQSNDGANSLKIRNQTSATDTTGVSVTFTANTNTANETPSLAFTAGDCASFKFVSASPATDPVNIKMHASLYFTVP